MKNNVIRAISLILALLITITLAGCKASGGQNSSMIEYVTEIEEEIVYVDGASGPNTSSIESNASSQNNPSNDKVVSNSTPLSEIDKFRGTTVKFAVTSDPMLSEKAYVINNFEQEYGIKIEPVIIKGDFITELTSLIAAGNSPDITRSSGDFPLSLSYLQSLDAAKLDYTNSIWEQGMFKLTTFGGSPYLCTTEGNVYTETDIVVYRKDILQQAGCKTPEEYAAEGKWNIDAYFEITRECVKKVDSVKGCSFVNYDSMIHMTGNSVFKYKDGKFVNGLTDSTSEVFDKLASAKKDNLITINSTKGIVDGSVAITTHHSYALRKTGAYEDYPEIWDKLGYYYLPQFASSDTQLKTGLVRGWGLIRGAKNPVAAGAFLTYYLDPNNCDVSNMYISTDAETFFFRATDIDYDHWNPYYTYGGKLETVAGIKFNDDIYSNIGINKSQFESALHSINTKIDKACENINYYVAQEIYTAN